jgi:hypothetical protein
MKKTNLLALGFMVLICSGCAVNSVKSNDRMPAAFGDNSGAITYFSCSSDGESGIVVQTEVLKMSDGTYLIKQVVPHESTITVNWQITLPSTAKADSPTQPFNFNYSDNNGTVVNFFVRGMGSMVSVQSTDPRVNFKDLRAECFLINRPAP